jgi:O-methyltransferase domain
MFTTNENGDSFADMAFLARAFQVSAMIQVAASLELADRVAEGTKPITALALEAGAEPTMLLRLCRALAAFGIFAVDADGNLSQTPRSMHLRQTAAPTLHYAAQYYASPHVRASWVKLEHAVRTGESAFQSVFHMPKFEYLKSHPAEAAVFDAFMRHSPEDRHAAVVDAYDFSDAGLVVDIGGGNGALLVAILKANPQAKGLLFDQAHVVTGATDALGAFVERLQIVDGSFFQTVPSEGDLYTMSQILHDWNDADCLKILGNLHAAMRPNTRLLVIERLLEVEAIRSNPMIYLSDINMMVNLQGRERTFPEFTGLLTQTGFSPPLVIRTRSSFCILETIRL